MTIESVMARKEQTGGPEQVLEQHLSQRGLKSTRQRSTIVNTFFAQTGHLSVDDLLRKVRVKNPRVSAATVYRTMKLLGECGLAHARQFGDGQTRWEVAGDRHHHDHLICTRCGTIVEFENDQIEHLQDLVARHHGFTVTHHKMELYGLCRDCQRQQKQPRISKSLH
jgi:Fur family transcriptional regulator, ferric uptake regulator